MLGQVGGHQQLHSFLTDHLVTRGVPAPGNVGIDRYLSGGTGSRGNAHQVYRGAAAPFLNVLDRPLAQGQLHETASIEYRAACSEITHHAFNTYDADLQPRDANRLRIIEKPIIISKCHPERNEGSKVPENMVLTPLAMLYL